MYIYERGWENADLLRCGYVAYLDYYEHVHPCMEYTFCLSGQVSVKVENQEIVLKDNEAVFVPPHTIHNRRIEPGSQVIVLLYGRNWTPDFANQFARSVPERYTFHLDEPFRELLMDYAEGHQSVYASKALLYYACDRFMEGNSLKPQEKKRDDVTVRMLEYIQDNFHEELTLEEFAAKNNFSYHYVSKLVKKNFGISFTELLARCRVDYACSLLSGREHSITQIAGMSGFGSIRNFNRVFLRVTGLTPTEYLEVTDVRTLQRKKKDKNSEEETAAKLAKKTS